MLDWKLVEHDVKEDNTRVLQMPNEIEDSDVRTSMGSSRPGTVVKRS